MVTRVSAERRGRRPTMRRRVSTRTTLAVKAGQLASWLSRTTGRGNGGTIGGRVTLALAPRALAELSRDRVTVLVTGTNGKTTTSAMIARGLRTLGPVASNADGANLPGGLVTALSRASQAPYAVLEVDERYLPRAVTACQPAMAVLLNLSRDQLDRVGEVVTTERAIRDALRRSPATTVVANCDGVLTVSAAADSPSVVWVAAEGVWHGDEAVCPRCGRPLRDRDGMWHCECGLSRPESAWSVRDGTLVGPDGPVGPVDLALPGAANRANAAVAVAAATTLGASASAALDSVRSLAEVSGRYRRVQHAGHDLRLLLAKNPAGWAETLAMLRGDHYPAVLVVNAHSVDGRDPSWLWDVPFEQLRGRPVVAGGERAADLSVRLTYAEVEHTVCDDPVRAVEDLPPGTVDLIGNYTAFLELSRRFRR